MNEGSTVQLDGTGTNDPEGNPLTYQWFPQGNLDDPALAQPTYTGVDDLFGLVVLYVYDQIEALYSTEFTSITVNNVPPSVIAVGDATDEGEPATVQATFTDPGLVDTHSATIDWGDGMGPQAVSLQQLGAGVQHVYGDNATFERRLEDGTRFRVVKVPHTVADLQRRLRELGWAAEVHQTAGPFYRGTA